jgi:nicotinamide-nucleotide amidase
MIDEHYSLAEQLGQRLHACGAKVTTAESCTGGGIAHAITAVPGSSRWFECGFVTYSNEAKHQLLNVPVATLQTYGAVSSEVVRAMAGGAARVASADFAVAVSGIAGPDGGSVEKPVGTVWFAWYHPVGLVAECHHFSGDRGSVREQAVCVALRGLLRQLDTV